MASLNFTITLNFCLASSQKANYNLVIMEFKENNLRDEYLKKELDLYFSKALKEASEKLSGDKKIRIRVYEKFAKEVVDVKNVFHVKGTISKSKAGTFIYVKMIRPIEGVSDEFIAGSPRLPYSKEQDISEISKRLAEELIGNLLGKPLKPPLTRLVVEAHPKNALISFSSDSFYERNPSPAYRDFRPEEYIVYIEAPKDSYYESKLEKIQVKHSKRGTAFGGNEVRVKVELNHKMGHLKFNMDLRDALVYIDKSRVFDDDKNLFSSKAGEHGLTIITKNGLIYKQKIFVEPNTVNFIKLNAPLNNIFQKYESPLVNQSQKGGGENKSERIVSLATFGNAIYFVNGSGVLEAIDAFSHDKKWTFRKFRIVDKPFFVNDRLFVICQIQNLDLFGELYTHFLVELDKNSGEIIWRSPFYGSTWAKGVVHDNVALFIFDQNMALYFVNPKNKNEKPKKKSIHEYQNKEKHPRFNLNWRSADMSDSSLFVLDSKEAIIRVFNLQDSKYWDFEKQRKFDKFWIAGNSIIGANKKGYIEFLNVTSGNAEIFYRKGSKTAYRSIDRIPLSISDLGDDILIKGDNVYIVSKDNHYWKISLKSREFEEGDILLAQNDYLSFKPTEHQATLGNTPLLTGVEVDAMGNLIVIDRSHNTKLYAPDLKCILWHQLIPDPVSVLVCADFYTVVGSSKGGIYTFGQSSKPKGIIGWVEEINEMDQSLNVRCCNKPLSKERYFLVTNIDDILGEEALDKIKFEKISFSGASISDDGLLHFALEPLPGKINVGDLVFSAGAISIDAEPKLKRSYLFIDNYFIGHTPKKMLNLQPGKYHISIRQRGRENAEKIIDIGAKSNIPVLVNEKLQEKPELQFKAYSAPRSAEIYIEGEPKGQGYATELHLNENQVLDISIHEDGYLPKNIRVKVTKDSVERDFKLSPDLSGDEFYLLYNNSNSPSVIGWRFADLSANEGNVYPLITDGDMNMMHLGYSSILHFGNLINAKIIKNVFMSYGFQFGFSTTSIDSYEFNTNSLKSFDMDAGLHYFIGKLPIIGYSSVGFSMKFDIVSAKWQKSHEAFFSSIQSKTYFNADVFIRPVEGLIIQFRGGFLKDSSFSIDDNYYTFGDELVSGNLFSVRTSWALKKLPVKILSVYEYQSNRFSSVKDKSHFFSIGLSVKGFISILLKKLKRKVSTKIR